MNQPLPPKANQPHRARKRFGQNFLHDESVIDNIVAAIRPKPKQILIEIGPGQAALTQPIAAKTDSSNAFHLIELDRDLAARLQQLFQRDDNVYIHQGDALFFDFARLSNAKAPLRVFGNLPYNISTPLLFHLLDQNSAWQQEHGQPLISDMHFMLQKEVIDRICAEPCSKAYGRLSVMAQYYCAVESLFEVPPEAFSPAPKVTSAVLRMTPHAEKTIVARSEATLHKVVQQAFSQRRKTLRNTLAPLMDEATLKALAIDPSARAETLSTAQFVDIANAVASKDSEH